MMCSGCGRPEPLMDMYLSQANLHVCFPGRRVRLFNLTVKSCCCAWVWPALNSLLQMWWELLLLISAGENAFLVILHAWLLGSIWALHLGSKHMENMTPSRGMLLQALIRIWVYNSLLMIWTVLSSLDIALPSLLADDLCLFLHDQPSG
jgi:hypothetical protein